MLCERVRLRPAGLRYVTVITPRGRRWLRRAAQLVGLAAVFAIAVLAVVFSEQVQERFAGLGYLASS